MIFSLIRNKLFIPIGVALAAGVPYVAMDEELRNKTSSILSGSSEDEESLNPLADDAMQKMMGDPLAEEGSIRSHVNTSSTPLLFTPSVEDLRDVFRFDVTPNWVKSRWPRVSACAFEDGMDGMRVPLVTGTTPSDISGSLTYYFDSRHQVQRITFMGFCGDARELAALAMQQFGFQAQATNSAGLYLKTYHGAPVGALRLISASVIRSNDPHHQLEVMMEINNPRGTYRMSSGFTSILNEDRLAGRWQ